MHRYPRVFERLQGITANGADSWKALCPAHPDRKPSLAIDIAADDGRLLLLCGAGCKNADIVDRLGIEWRDLFPMSDKGEIVATYSYRDEAGTELYQVCRFNPKDFRQRRWCEESRKWEWSIKGVRRVLYHLPELLKAPKKTGVFIVEGEKDVEALERLGLVATTNAGGAGKWSPDYNEALRGRVVIILPDNDNPGRKHADEVRESLDGIAKSVKVIELPGLPEKGDVSDWIAAGGTVQQLRELVKGNRTTQAAENVEEPHTAVSQSEIRSKPCEPCELLALTALVQMRGKYAPLAEEALARELHDRGVLATRGDEP